MHIYKLSSMIALLGVSAPLIAQQGVSCPNGPGSAFGIVAYQCANCAFKHESDRPPTYTFFAEPVVTQVDRLRALTSAVMSGIEHASNRPVIVVDGIVQGSAAVGDVAVGDVIEAVDGHPITTQAGADLFTYPTAGAHALTVRRGRDRQVIEISLPASCSTTVTSRATAAGASGVTVSTYSYGSGGAGAQAGGTGAARAGDDSIHFGSGSGKGNSSSSTSSARTRRGYGLGVPEFFGDTIEIINGTAVTHGSGSSPAIGRFGFAVECRPSCSLNRSPRGDYYYKYDGYPRIIEVRERSAADRAGLRVGDLITKVEGRSILDGDALRGSQQGNQLHITIRRDGKDIDVSMLVVP